MTNIEQRINMYHLVSQVLAYGVEGDFVELGCNTGDSSNLIKKLLQTHNSDKKFAVYDSFEGLPAAQPIDGTIYKEGYRRTSQDVLEENFRAHKLPVPEIHKGWFQDTLPNGLPDRISCLPRWRFYY
jgi:O-methyltransferase